MTDHGQRIFFDRLAETWDAYRGRDDQKLSRLIEMAGLRAGDRVLDIGCGTGVLIPFLKAAVGAEGSVVGLDFSANMIAQAQKKHGPVSGVSYAVADILEYRPDVLFTHITCLNFYPHIQDKRLFFNRMNTLLEGQGALTVMHDMSRAAVNAIHGQSRVVTEDRLPPAADVAGLFVQNGFTVEAALDTNDFYFIQGRKA
jgi:ubiquinone/menaquinone biosynthesis C-methylase UbiE